MSSAAECLGEGGGRVELHLDHNTANNNDLLVKVDLSNLEKDQIPELRFFVEDLLPEKAVTLVSGHGGVGKTFLAIEVAAHIACGRDFAGLKVIKSRVLFLSLEDNYQTLKRRLKLIIKHFDLNYEDIEKNLAVYDGSEVGPLVEEVLHENR
jgi:hypothetical protein